MQEWIAQNWSSILLTLVTTGALAFCRWCWKNMQNYRTLLNQQEDERMEEAVEEKLAPILHEIEELRAYIRNVDSLNTHHLNLIIASYRYRLIQLCKIYLKQGYLTPAQFDQINEFYTLYHELGGNSSADDYYNKIKTLQVKDDDSIKPL